ncbi:MAG TPA: glycosyltransferase [Dongiaceae bacterium]|nr:glycosyltransferase [Dongiaceae bacterium]
MTPKILIVSVYYDRENMVDESVQSLVSQLEPDMHLLLVDDGSPDKTFEKLKAWEAPNVTVTTHPNMGFVFSIRQAIESIPSTYIAIHGSGDLSLPGRFRKQADYMDQHPEVGVVGCRSRSVFSSGEAPPYIEGKPFTGDASRFLLTRNLFHQGEVMMRRESYEKVGGYRTFFKFAQDRDLFCRLSQVTHFHVINEVLYNRYVAVPGSVSGTASKLIVQRFLSDFACYCHAQRLANKADPLDEHGPRAALFWSPSKRIRKEVFRRAIRALYFKRVADYEIFKDALLQKDTNLVRRLFFVLAERFPTLTSRFLDAYYKNKLAGADVT